MARARKSPKPAAIPLGPPIPFDPAAVDALLGGRTTMAELDDLFRQMKKTLMERALSGELTHHKASLGLRSRRAQAAGATEPPQWDDAQDGPHRGRAEKGRHNPYRRSTRS